MVIDMAGSHHRAMSPYTRYRQGYAGEGGSSVCTALHDRRTTSVPVSTKES